MVGRGWFDLPSLFVICLLTTTIQKFNRRRDHIDACIRALKVKSKDWENLLFIKAILPDLDVQGMSSDETDKDDPAHPLISKIPFWRRRCINRGMNILERCLGEDLKLHRLRKRGLEVSQHSAPHHLAKPYYHREFLKNPYNIAYAKPNDRVDAVHLDHRFFTEDTDDDYDADDE